MIPAEDARVQEDATGDDIPDLVDDTTQFRNLDGYVANVLLRVRRTSLGNRASGCQMRRVRS